MAGRAAWLTGRAQGGSVPAPPPHPVRGRVVFDSAWFPLREHASSGFSKMGNRRLLLTDLPAVYVHDTSVLGAAVWSALEPAVDPDAAVELVDFSNRLVVDLRLPAGRTFHASTVAPLPPEALATLTSLQGRLLADAASTSFVSPCAVSITPLFEDDPGTAARFDIEPLGHTAPPPPLAPPTGTAPPASPASPASPAPPVPVAPLPELAAYVVVRGGRLELRARGRTLVDWPRNRIEVSAAGPTAARLRGGAVLDGRFLTGAILHLVTPQVLHAFLAAAGPGPVTPTDPPDSAASGPGTPGSPAAGTGVAGAGGPRAASAIVSAPVSARGLAAEAGVVRVDCVLSDAALELQELHSSRVLARFDLTDSRLRVAGSADRFVIFDPDQGPVTVQSESAVFGRRLREHPAVRAAAELTLAAGPYPAELADGRPVACAVAADALRVRGPGVDLRLPFTDLQQVAGTSGAHETFGAPGATGADGPSDGAGTSEVARARLRVVTGTAEMTVVGQLELTRAIHTDVVAGRNALADPRAIPDLLRAAVGLEEDYFLYTIFGPFYELHAVLLGDGSGSDLGRWVPIPAEDEERARAAATLAEGLVELQRHLDQVGSVLPAFVRHRDARLLEPVTGGREPAWLKAQEGRLRTALLPAQRAAAETGQLAAQVSRLLDLDPAALPRPDYTGAAVSLGVAALLNPVFLVSGASQVYSRYTQAEKRTAAVGAQSARGWATVIDRWNVLVTTTLPVLGYVLTENLFTPRWETARLLARELRGTPADAQEAVLGGVARRLAQLDVLRRYPANSGIGVGRGAIADHLRTARDAVRTPRFADF